MGPIKVPKAYPQNYLKKHRMQPKAPSKQTKRTHVFRSFFSLVHLHICLPEAERHICPERKPAIPDSKNKLRLIRKKFDYVSAAIAETRHADRTRPQAIADSHKGHKYFPQNSGLFPEYVNKKVIIWKLQCLGRRGRSVRANICSDVCRTMEKSPHTCNNAQKKRGTAWRTSAASC